MSDSEYCLTIGVLTSVQNPINLVTYKETKKLKSPVIAGIDGSSWLYKGAYSCVLELATNKPTELYVNYVIDRALFLREKCDIVPYFVFDGRSIPVKHETNLQRQRQRQECRERGLQVLRDGDTSTAYKHLRRCISITPEMTQKLMKALERVGIEYMVAPFEADAQLAFLSKRKRVQLVISEDSDCIPYGCKKIIFKLDADGYGQELLRRNMGSNEDVSFLGWSEEMLLSFCVLAGCDYCPSVPGIGVRTAHKYVSQYRQVPQLLDALQVDKRDDIPNNYRRLFLEAVLTFRHHYVYDSISKKCVMLSDLKHSTHLLAELDYNLSFLGDVIDSQKLDLLCLGQLHPHTLQPFPPCSATSTNNADQGKFSTSSPKSSSFTKAFMKYVEENDKSNPLSNHESQRSANVSSIECKENDSAHSNSHQSRSNLSSLLGSSSHILNFESPNVSCNYHALVDPASLNKVTASNATALDQSQSQGKAANQANNSSSSIDLTIYERISTRNNLILSMSKPKEHKRNKRKQQALSRNTSYSLSELRKHHKCQQNEQGNCKSHNQSNNISEPEETEKDLKDPDIEIHNVHGHASLAPALGDLDQQESAKVKLIKLMSTSTGKNVKKKVDAEFTRLIEDAAKSKKILGSEQWANFGSTTNKISKPPRFPRFASTLTPAINHIANNDMVRENVEAVSDELHRLSDMDRTIPSTAVEKWDGLLGV